MDRLLNDLTCLAELTSAPIAPKIPVQARNILYGFGDALGDGFRRSVQVAHGMAVQFGLCGTDKQGTSSNQRELLNLVESVEEAVVDGQGRDVELFLFMDNAVSEGASHKGTSNNEEHFKLVLHLCKAEMRVCGCTSFTLPVLR